MINEYLLDFIGKSNSQNVLNDAKKFVLEEKSKALKFAPRPNVISLVHTENKNEIMQIGASKPDDLISDNLLIILAGMFGTPTSENRLIQLIPTDGILRDFHVIARQPASGSTTTYTSMYASTAGGLSCNIQVGKGVTGATRQDFKIEDPFANGGLEDGINPIGAPVYNPSLSRNSFATSFLATGLGGISETVLQTRYMTNLTGGRTTKLVQLSRDNISPIVSFIASESVFVEYVFQY